MQLFVEKRFLRIPVTFSGEPFRFALTGEGVSPYWFFAVYTKDTPDAVYFADLRDYVGQTLELAAPEDFTPVFSDAMEPLSDAENAMRPSVRYTAERGWLNDPNGLFCLDGTYHLYHQHNPFGRTWGNMHWGHAVSRDLLHWEYREEALFQDEYGMMFSGCAVIDRENVSALGTADQPPVLFFYTNCGEKVSAQWLAYSTDGGETLQKYGEVVWQIAPGNRDPKVIFDAARARWLMALYLENETYGILTSEDLLHWTLLQQFDLPGDNECPDLYPLTADDGRTLWVYSGAHDRYWIGDFDGEGKFQPVQDVGQLSYGSASYAAQTYYVEPGQPVIRVAWDRSEIPGAPFNGAMCTPTLMFLKKRGDRYDLCMKPVDQLESLVVKETEIFDSRESALTVPVSSPACRVDIEAEHGSFTCSVCGLEVRTEEDAVHAGDAILPLPEGEPVSFTVIADKTSTEIFVNGSAFTVIPRQGENGIGEIAFRSETALWVRSLRVAELAL